jgi:glycosyltransferase involved in cell wall biosynthesis
VGVVTTGDTGRGAGRFSRSVEEVSPVTAVCVVLPEGVDDPARPSGGNRYDRRLCDGLAARGWDVRERVVPGSWPHPDNAALAALARTVGALPDGGLLLVDGLIASAAAGVLAPEARRLRLVVLVHMPFGGLDVPADDERAVLAAAAAVVTTSAWTRDRLLERYGLPAHDVTVAHPGTDRVPTAPGTSAGERLLCVGAVTPLKGQDLLVDALGRLVDRAWTCTIVGRLDRDPAFVERLRAAAPDRVVLTGPLAGEALAEAYRRADLLVHPSRLEAYGMVVAEALFAGLPVVATDVGGVAEALGTTWLGVPGVLVRPDDPQALADALGGWLGDPRLRTRLRRAALTRRDTLPGWDATAARVAGVLAGAGRIGAPT